MKYWFVNLGRYYKEQRNGNFLWAPLYNESGNSVYYWENMTEVQEGDIIFCNKNAHIVSIGIAKSIAYECDIPDCFNNDWKKRGRKINVDFLDLDMPFKFSDYKEYILKNIRKDHNPFDNNGNAKLGYLFSFDEKIAEYFLKLINSDKVNEFICLAEYQMAEALEEKEQFESINNGLVRSYTEDEIKNLENKPYSYVEQYTNGKSKLKREATDDRLKQTRLEKASYCCEIDDSHTTFLNSSGTHQYMECHHIIPIYAQKNFSTLKLDSMFNLISVCPICHRKIHYAVQSEKEELFFKMYKVREKEMLSAGFDLSKMKEIFDKYYKK